MYAERGIADRYCCWLHIISAGARAKAAASWGVNYLLFQPTTNTEEYQDKLPLQCQVCVPPVTGSRRYGVLFVSHQQLAGTGSGTVWEEMLVALAKCPALEEHRNLISTFSETGVSGCANTNALQAVQSKPSVVQQKTPTKPQSRGQCYQLCFILY